MSSFFDSIGNGLTDAVDKVGDIGGSIGGDLSNALGGVTSSFSGILSAFGLGGLFGSGGTGGNTDWSTYLEYGMIGVGIILLVVLMKKLIVLTRRDHQR